ncbi:tRNA (uridine(54)-C5)-methyltransferase TrmA [Campylobacter sp. CCS1377]|uniref:tRNA (Uridine(54)-C5)-methyltransferase TrmA n=1 Tax=Campylobacter sp. CCS1377 TaxID=3158229 RepID=A0AAU7E677_9BACT|nr:tRNA (uridine(54)-C5)-methyltransferase TrmA [Campylobacter jejuni]
MLAEKKFQDAKDLFQAYFSDFECIKGPLQNYRTRAEFSFFHDENGLHYAMFDPYTKKKHIIKHFPIAVQCIQDFMPLLLEKLNANASLKQKIFGVEFLATKNDFSATLLYHKDIELIKDQLQNLSEELNLKLIARSRGKKLVFKSEIVRQNLQIFDKEVLYEFNNDCFIQPNTFINEKMIEWVIKAIENDTKQDLLELYCGYGNFTLPLATHFNQVLGTEISKSNINFALRNCELNHILNIQFIRLSSEELSKALKKERKFFRLKNIHLDNYHFSHVLVDPPRAGLDESVIRLIRNYENIIYISCNPISLKQNLEELLKTHKILKFAFFDQFANTPHLECGILLRKIL